MKYIKRKIFRVIGRSIHKIVNLFNPIFVKPVDLIWSFGSYLINNNPSKEDELDRERRRTAEELEREAARKHQEEINARRTAKDPNWNKEPEGGGYTLKQLVYSMQDSGLMKDKDL